MREGSPWLELDVAVPTSVGRDVVADQVDELPRGGVYKYAIWRYTCKAYRWARTARCTTIRSCEGRAEPGLAAGARLRLYVRPVRERLGRGHANVRRPPHRRRSARRRRARVRRRARLPATHGVVAGPQLAEDHAMSAKPPSTRRGHRRRQDQPRRLTRRRPSLPRRRNRRTKINRSRVGCPPTGSLEFRLENLDRIRDLSGDDQQGIGNQGLTP
jgi:hypothetical protein